MPKKFRSAQQQQGKFSQAQDKTPTKVSISFAYFHWNEPSYIPRACPKYLWTLFDKMTHLSRMTVIEFRSKFNDKNWRSHVIDFAYTTERNGFNLNDQQMQAGEPWQFSLSVNEHGRVHGLLSASTFYVVWFDPDHKLYPQKA